MNAGALKLSSLTRAFLIVPMALALACLSISAQAALGGSGADTGKKAYTIKFKPGTMIVINEEEIKQAALQALEKGYMLQVEGYSCGGDGDGGGKATHRIEQGEKRAEEIRARIIKFGVLANNVFTIAYDHGECAVVISAY